MRQLSVAVVGANYPNSDGGNRRSEIAFCDIGEELALVPEPKNQYDEHAIAVFSARNFQIGYVASQRAVFLRKLLNDGHTLTAIFQDVAPWGAIARVGVDCCPTLPEPRDDSDFDDRDWIDPPVERDPWDYPDEDPQHDFG